MGWARANILFEKSRRLPDPGSLMEMVYLMVWKMRQDIEFQKQRTLVQAFLCQIGGKDEELLKSFDDLKDVYFPYLRSNKKKGNRDLKAALDREVARGALAITVQDDGSAARKQKFKLRRGNEELERRLQMERHGEMRPIDTNPYDEARKRARSGR